MKTIQKHGDRRIHSLIPKLITGRISEEEYMNLSETDRLHLLYRSLIVVLYALFCLVLFSAIGINILRMVFAP